MQSHDAIKASVFRDYRFCPYTYRLYGSRLRFFHSLRYRRFFAFLEPFAARVRGKDVLEIGCSDLFTLAMLCEGGCVPRSYTGVDIFWEDAERFAAANARRIEDRFAVRVVVRNLSSEQPLGSDRFDAALVLETLEHVNDEAATIENLSRALRPGGLLLLAVPVEFGLLFAFKESARILLSGRSQYRLGEFLHACAGRLDRVRRVIGDHKGYDYRLTRQSLLRCGFSAEAQTFFPGPVDFLGYSYLSAWKKAGEPGDR